MARDSEFMPRTYSIKGYTKKGLGIRDILRFVLYSIGILAVLSAVVIIIIFAV